MRISLNISDKHLEFQIFHNPTTKENEQKIMICEREYPRAFKLVLIKQFVHTFSSSSK